MFALLAWAVPLCRSNPTPAPPPSPSATHSVPSSSPARESGFTQSQLQLVYAAISATALLIIIEGVLTIYCRHRNREPSAPEDDEIAPTLSALELEE
jgi:hypothetical protein